MEKYDHSRNRNSNTMGKENYDKMDYAWQKERREMNKHIAELKRNRVAQKEINAAQNE